MRGRLLVAALGVVAIAITVIVAFATRSEFAEVNPGGGVFIIVACGAVAAAAAWLIRVVPVLVVTELAAASLASAIAWAVLHDEASTAAIGVVAPPIISGLVSAIGIGTSYAIDASRSRRNA